MPRSRDQLPLPPPLLAPPVQHPTPSTPLQSPPCSPRGSEVEAAGGAEELDYNGMLYRALLPVFKRHVIVKDLMDCPAISHKLTDSDMERVDRRLRADGNRDAASYLLNVLKTKRKWFDSLMSALDDDHLKLQEVKPLFHSVKEKVNNWFFNRTSPPDMYRGFLPASSTSETRSLCRVGQPEPVAIPYLQMDSLSLRAEPDVMPSSVPATSSHNFSAAPQEHSYELDCPDSTLNVSSRRTTHSSCGDQQLEGNVDTAENAEKVNHHVRNVVNLQPDGAGRPAIGSLSGGIPDTNISRSQSPSISQSQGPSISQSQVHNKSMQANLKKETDTQESNLLSGYTAARTTQTDPAPAQNVPSPVFCIGPTWQIHGSIDRSGGSLQKPKSDVVLKVPPNAIARDEYVDVHMSVCADVEQIHRSLDLKDSDFVASPLAEFWAGEKFRFQRPVQIVLPHCLPRGVNLDEVVVYRATKNIHGELILQQVPNQHQSASNANNTVAQVAPSGSSDVQPSYHLEGNKLVINTDGFSGFTCVHCKRKNKGTSTVLFVGSWDNKLRRDTMTQTASVHVHVWDERLDVRDFLENSAPTRKTNNHRLVLYSVKDATEIMTFSLDVVGENASSWRHLLRPSGRPAFNEEQTIMLADVLGCDSKICSAFHPTRLQWQLETVAPSKGQWLHCVVDVVHQASKRQTSMFLELQGPRGGSTELSRDVLETLTLDELRTKAQGMGVDKAILSDMKRRNRSDEARQKQLIDFLLHRFDTGREKDRKKKHSSKGSKLPETQMYVSNMSSLSSSSATCDSTATDSSDDCYTDAES